MTKIDLQAIDLIVQATNLGIAPTLDGDGWISWEVNGHTVLLGYSGFIVLEDTKPWHGLGAEVEDIH
jgi:hypothetical protein